MTEEREIAQLTRLVREFSTERDWQQFHDPKSVILALVGEVGELAELFQWVPADEAVERFAAPDRKARAAEEMADVLVYLVCLADVLGVDLGRRPAPSWRTRTAGSRPTRSGASRPRSAD